MTDDNVVMFFCSKCGDRMPAPTGRCEACAKLFGYGKRRRTWQDKRADRARRCTVCGAEFRKNDERVLVRLPPDVHSDWSPRSTLVHSMCAPLGEWPRGESAWDERPKDAA